MGQDHESEARARSAALSADRAQRPHAVPHVPGGSGQSETPHYSSVDLHAPRRPTASAPLRSPLPAGLPPSVATAVSSPGRPLAAVPRRAMEAQLGWDFSSVRVHDDQEAHRAAHDLSARALTVGDHVVVSERADLEATPSLLAHELTHVVQHHLEPAPSGPPPVHLAPDEGRPRGTLEVTSGPVEVDVDQLAEMVVDDQLATRPGVRFEPGLVSLVKAATIGVDAGGRVRAALEALSNDQAAAAAARVEEVARSTGLSRDSLQFIDQHGLKAATAQTLGLLDSFIKIASLGSDEQRETWAAREAADNPLLDALSVTEFLEVALAVPSACLGVIGSIGGAVSGSASGIGLLAGASRVWSSKPVGQIGKVLGAAGAVLAVADGALTMATAADNEEFVHGVTKLGTGTGTLGSLAAGASAGPTLLVGLGGGTLLGAAAYVATNIGDVSSGAVGYELTKLEGRLLPTVRSVALHATLLDSTLAAEIDTAVQDGSPAGLGHRLQQRVHRETQHLAFHLHRLLTTRGGPTGDTVNDYLVAAAGGERAIPTAQDVEWVGLGNHLPASTMVQTARRVLRAMEQLIADPPTRGRLVKAAKAEVYRRR